VTAEILAGFQAQAGAGPAGAEADAGLHVAVGRLATALEAQRRADLAAAEDIWVVDVPAHAMPLSGGAGTLDVANEMGPRDGYAWAVHWMAAAGFTSGTVSLYLGANADTVASSNLRFAFLQAGVWEPPRTATILLPGTRMIFVASGITGNVVVAGQVTQMKLHMLPRFLT
jgi:hypothetical protein